MSRQYSRRAAIGVLGAGLVGLTGAAAPDDCTAFSSDSSCGSRLSLSGPDTVTVSAGATDPRFALANETDQELRVADVTWTLYRRGSDWERVAIDRSNGASTTLAPGEETAWAVLARAENAGYATATDATTASSTTRYVGPISLSPGAHAFVVVGHVDGDRFEVTAHFQVE